MFLCCLMLYFPAIFAERSSCPLKIEQRLGARRGSINRASRRSEGEKKHFLTSGHTAKPFFFFFVSFAVNSEPTHHA